MAGDTTGAGPWPGRDPGAPPAARGATRPFSVLAVCRANQCRSPMVEYLMREQVNQRGLPWRVASAGVDAESGRPMHPSTARALSRRGVRLTMWASQPLSDPLVGRADLILTASEAHRGVIAVRFPGALRRTFTLLSFASLAGRLRCEPGVAPEEYGPWLVAEVNRVRVRSQPLPVTARDLPDPLGQPYHRFRSTAATVAEAVAAILAAAPQVRAGLASTA